MSMYTVAEFRKDIKRALDQASRGEDVQIHRHGMAFTVKATAIVEQGIKIASYSASPATEITEQPTLTEPPMHTVYTRQPFVPKPPDPETGYPCCQSTTYRCKHWVWDETIPAWKNSLTGMTRER